MTEVETEVEAAAVVIVSTEDELPDADVIAANAMATNKATAIVASTGMLAPIALSFEFMSFVKERSED
jgi:hypothetical protein